MKMIASQYQVIKKFRRRLLHWRYFSPELSEMMKEKKFWIRWLRVCAMRNQSYKTTLPCKNGENAFSSAFFPLNSFTIELFSTSSSL